MEKDIEKVVKDNKSMEIVRTPEEIAHEKEFEKEVAKAAAYADDRKVKDITREVREKKYKVAEYLSKEYGQVAVVPSSKEKGVVTVQGTYINNGVPFKIQCKSELKGIVKRVEHVIGVKNIPVNRADCHVHRKLNEIKEVDEARKIKQIEKVQSKER